MKRWDQCTALVTGGKGDIGKAITADLIARGVTVFTTSREANSNTNFHWDMSEDTSSSALIKNIKSKKLTFDMLVHCAHIFSTSNLIFQVKPEDFEKSLSENIAPLYALLRQISRSMYRKGFGRILLMGSQISIYGGAGKISYIVEKSAFNGLAMGFSAEFYDAGVSTNVLHPSVIDTETIRDRVDSEILERLASANTSGKLLSIEDVVYATIPLIDPTIKVLSGQQVELTGGAQW